MFFCVCKLHYCYAMAFSQLIINKIACHNCYCVEQQELMFTELKSKLMNTERNLQTVNECEGN